MKTACPLCAAHYGGEGVCDEGKPVNSPHRKSALVHTSVPVLA